MTYLLGPVLFGTEAAADLRRAANWFRAAALHGSAKGQFVLAQMNRTGVSVPATAARAAALRAAATGGNASPDANITTRRQARNLGARAPVNA